MVGVPPPLDAFALALGASAAELPSACDAPYEYLPGSGPMWFAGWLLFLSLLYAVDQWRVGGALIRWAAPGLCALVVTGHSIRTRSALQHYLQNHTGRRNLPVRSHARIVLSPPTHQASTESVLGLCSSA